MPKPQKPKFRIGETIVIGFLGTVGKVTGIKRLEGKILYEVNNREGLFQEDALFFIEEFEGNITKYEKVEIAYKFMIGDIVKVRGFKHDLFKVIGYRTEIWRYYQDGWEETVYELYRIKDAEWLEADEEDLELIGDEGHTAQSASYELQSPVRRTTKNKQENRMNELLDRYNDYKYLYTEFKDAYYKKKMDETVKLLMQLHQNESQ